MDRLGMTYRLRPGAKEVYLRAHREIWPEMQDYLKRSGVGQMSIFLRGDTLFLYAEIEDLERYDELGRTDPVSDRWESWMATLLASPYDDEEAGIFARLDEVWHIES